MKIVNMPLKKCLTGKKLKSVKGVVIHWFADENATAENVINYWERKANGVSAHDLICLDGTVYHAVDYDQMTYQVGSPKGYTKEALERLSDYPNNCVVGIECAHLDMTGKMTNATYNSLVEHATNLLKKFNLTVDNLWLHSEIVGINYKDCHRFFSRNPEEWSNFKKLVDAKLNPPKPVVPPKQETPKPTQPKPVIPSLSIPKSTLKLGSKGTEVKQLQAILNKLNFVVKVDGDFGNNTKLALIKFQKANKLVADGIYGNATESAMTKLINKK
jgi:N-acetylmuramoyl-L-alanine amidase CwlA